MEAWFASHAGLMLDGCWLIFVAYWVAAARGTKQAKQKESLGSRWKHAGLMSVAGVLLIGPPGVRELIPGGDAGPKRLAVAVLLTALGVGFAIWARTTLGRNWSGRVTLKEDHELIRSGPYAFVRHPIYTGLLTAVVGSALAVGGLRGALAVVAFTAAVLVKIRIEERVLASEFADAHAAYARETKRLIPGLW